MLGLDFVGFGFDSGGVGLSVDWSSGSGVLELSTTVIFSASCRFLSFGCL